MDGKTIKQAMEEGSHAIYIGTTKLQLKDEALRWLTKRGAQNQIQTRSGTKTYKKQKNRPVLLRLNGNTIKMKEANDELDACMEVIHQSRLRLNETSIEEYMQQSIQQFPLGQRLHRWVAMGAKLAEKAEEELMDPDFLCKTFITTFPITAICNQKVGNKPKPQWVELNGKRLKVQH